jgi:hypothetical protein
VIGRAGQVTTQQKKREGRAERKINLEQRRVVLNWIVLNRMVLHGVGLNGVVWYVHHGGSRLLMKVIILVMSAALRG